MARKKVAPEEEIVNAAGEEVIPESIPVDTVLSNEICTDTETSPSDLPEGNLPAEESTEPSETLPAMEAAEAKPFGLSAAEKTASQEKNDTVEERAEEAELHEETSEFLEAAEDLYSDLPHLRRRVLRPMKRIGALRSRSRKKPLQNLRRMNAWQQITPKRLMRRKKRASARSSTSWTSMNWIGG